MYLDFLTQQNEYCDWFIPGHVPLINDRDTIAQLLPARRIEQHVISAWLKVGFHLNLSDILKGTSTILTSIA